MNMMRDTIMMMILLVGVMMMGMMSVGVEGTAEEKVFVQTEMSVCEGDTRGDRKCNHDATHRVCAKIGLADTSFFHHTGQTNWCGTIGYYSNSPYGDQPRCPPEHPTYVSSLSLSLFVVDDALSDERETSLLMTLIRRWDTDGVFVNGRRRIGSRERRVTRVWRLIATPRIYVTRRKDCSSRTRITTRIWPLPERV